MAEPNNRYGLTAARTHGTYGRENRPPGMTVDIHAHVAVPEAARLVASHIQPDPRATLYTEDTRALGRKQTEDRAPNLTDLTLRMRDFNDMGLDAQVISPAPNQCYYDVPPDIGMQAARLVNNGIAKIMAAGGKRIPAAMGSVPLGAGGEAAAAELEHAMTTLGLKGVEVLAHVGDKELSDPSLEPFWARAEALGAVVFIHPAGFTEARRFTKYYFSNVIGNPLDTTMALHHLIFDGVLERYPALKIIASHGGGYLPAYWGRIDHAWGARSDAHGALPRPPSHYLKKIYLDTIVFTPDQLAFLAHGFGVGKLLLGTDYPYDMGEYDPLGHIASVASFSEADRSAIAGGNARTLFGF
ncbi:MAG TPA: amidohydrolase family protein [Rhodopila sp.]|uniref:amidohydrolase family protein n=1 Tax=Rhodopila sp. TaxID=2480087 RepID=UPI002CC3EBA0|nr:amidohydrolase family protein [Rhodopila sp.]HVY17095.1 amidohydrolase family protein [Rhodopila sp.]